MTDAAYLLAPSERDTFRDLTSEELKAWYYERVCPCCKKARAETFYRGPVGGRSQNVECPNCRCRLNICPTLWHGGFIPLGQLIRAPLPPL